MTRQEFIINYSRLYCWMKRNHKVEVLDKYIPSQTLHPKSFIKECENSASLFSHKTITEWRSNYNKHYDYVRRSGLLLEFKDKYFVSGKKNSRRKSVKCIEKNKTYESCAQAGRILNINYKQIADAAKNQKHTAGGYHWAYCDENGNIIKENI